jgi:lipopolysaccharide biosynthesis protein/glycosyltransferase involved in cell wall biosynthesis
MSRKEQSKELSHLQLKKNKPPKHYDTCVILHLYYPEMWDGILAYLSNLGNQFDLFITIPYEVDVLEETIKAVFPDAHIYRCENRGRDVAPFLAVFSAISKLGYKYVCKIHTKKSQYITNGSQWQDDMLFKLLGSRKIIAQIKKAFDNNPDWGIIAPQGHAVPHDFYWKQNAGNVIKLAHSVGIPTECIEFTYVAGSMFWFRPESLYLLSRLGLLTQDFDPEQGQIDGTLAHALERFFGMAANYAGFKIAESNLHGTVKLSESQFQLNQLIRAFQYQESDLTGQVSDLTGQVTHLMGQVSDLTGQVTHLMGQVSELTSQLSNKERELRDIYQSKAWRLIKILRQTRLWLLPYRSKRERVMFWIIRIVGIWRNEGLMVLLRKGYFRLKQNASRFLVRFSFNTASNDLQDTSYVPLNELDVDPVNVLVKTIAFYLPQYHPIPENDIWWGKGFTEWTNVSKAHPNFKGHYQPHIPNELGYYDLRLPEVQKQQVELAKKYGIYGFCFYYYWFAGKRLLERPLDQYLANPDLGLPFCLCWANENWTRRWDGAEHEILIGQTHNEQEYLHFIHDISSNFMDPRYIRVDGKPILLVYRINLLPDPQKAAGIWRDECKRLGIGDIYLVAVQSFGITDPKPYGFDAAVEFPPSYLGEAEVSQKSVKITNPKFKGKIFDYNSAARIMMQKRADGYTLFKSVMPSWDNTARRQNESHIFINSTPSAYKSWLETVVTYTRNNLPESQRFVFVNAWNEWAEGAHLEPDRHYGYAYLQATADAIAPQKNETTSTSNWTTLFVSHDAHKGGSQNVLLNTISWFKTYTSINIKILCLEGGELLPRFQELADTIVLSQTQQKDTKASKDSLTNLVLRFCNNKTPDLIFGNTVVAGIVYPWLNNLGAPILTHVHEMEQSIQYYGADSMDYVLQYSTHFLACSAAVRNNLISYHGISADKISIGHASIYEDPGLHKLSLNETNRKKKKLGLIQNKHLIFGCGIGMPFRKGADLFMDLGRILQREKRDDFHLYWIGEFERTATDGKDGIWADYLERLKQDNLHECVTFLGYKNNPKEYLQVGDIHVITSREEPFGLVALEAADCGVPTICFENAGAADFIGEDAGYVVPFEDLEAMAQKIILLMNNEDLRKTLGACAKEKFHKSFTVKQTTPHILSTCRKIAGKKPGVSVIVPNFNHAQYLPERLESIFNQTYQDFEVILLDDASSDNSLEVLEKYSDRADVSIIHNEQNTGSPFVQWLKGFNLAKGDLWWIAESDDISDPNFLRTLLPAFNYPHVKIAYVNSNVIDEKSALLGDYLNSDYLTALSLTKWSKSYRVPANLEINEALGIKDTVLNVSAVLFRKFDFDINFRQTLEKMLIAGDWYFIVNAIKGGEVYYDAKKLNYHRRHTESVIGKLIAGNKVENFYREMALIHQTVVNNYPLSATFHNKWEQYHRQQWKQFFNDRPFDELEEYYPFEEISKQIAGG